MCIIYLIPNKQNESSTKPVHSPLKDKKPKPAKRKQEFKEVIHN